MVKLMCALVGEERREFFVDIDADKWVAFLKKAIKAKNDGIIRCAASDLKLYLTKQDQWWFPSEDLNNVRWEILSGMTLMDPFLPINQYFGRDFQPGYRQIHVFARPLSFPGLKTFPPTEFDRLKEECIELPDWKAGTVHNIREIWKFMKPIGGCTSLGEILWRSEEQKVFSSILGRCDRATSDGSSFADMDLRSIVIGSPGIGKSAILVLMALYMFFKYKINVLIYRRVGNAVVGNCLIYLGYEVG